MKLHYSFLRFLKPYWRKEAVLLILIALGSAASLSTPYILKIIIDDIFPTKDFDKLINILLLLIALNVGRIVVNFITEYLMEWISNHIVLDMRRELLGHLLKLPISFYDHNKTGDVLHRMNSEISTVQNFLTGSVLRFVGNALTIIGLGIVLSLLNAQLLLISLITLPFIFLNTIYFQPKIRKALKQSRERDSEVLSYLIERLERVKLVKIFNSYRYEDHKFIGKVQSWIDINLKTVFISSTTKSISSILISFTPIFIFYWGGMLVIEDTLTIGALVAFIQYMNKLYDPLRDMMSLYIDAVRASVSMKRINELFEISEEKCLYPISDEYHINKSIDFVDVKFSYGDKCILNKLSLSIEIGKTYAIVGASGCGKSTILNIMCGFYQINSGAIYIDGKNKETIDISTLRERIMLVAQDNQLFHDSISANIKYGDDLKPEKDLINATQVTGIYDHIMSMEKRFESVIGNNGTKLSGGQKQRIALSRTMLKDTDILILDEATSALDSESEQQVLVNLKEQLKTRTLVIVSHRLSAIKEVDIVICLKDGQIVEKGSHDELVRLRGCYYALFKNQLEWVSA